tara:strand:+ start:1812 stop:2306 length:495 start_codon:yes stop_codon:yes gene_type:complete
MLYFDKDCTTEVAEELLNYYAEYVEGYIDSSKDRYNALIRKASKKDIMYTIFNTPFARHAIRLFLNSERIFKGDMLGDAEEFYKKLDKDIAHLNKMSDDPFRWVVTGQAMPRGDWKYFRPVLLNKTQYNELLEAYEGDDKVEAKSFDTYEGGWKYYTFLEHQEL